ncbi:hypothetical protein ACA910_008556 [Epithemia clementina (nom. ined.)]
MVTSNEGMLGMVKTADLLEFEPWYKTDKWRDEEVLALLSKCQNDEICFPQLQILNNSERNEDDGASLSVLIQKGDFTRLFRLLRKALIQYSEHQSNGFVGDTAVLRLQLCILSAGLEVATRLFPHILNEDLDECDQDMVSCIPQLLERTLSWTAGDDTLSVLAIKSTISVLSRMAQFFPSSIATFGISLLYGLRVNVPVDVQLHVACALVGLLHVRNDAEQRLIVLKQIDANHSVIIPILSTALTSGPQKHVRSALDAMLMLSHSPAIRLKLARRRGVVLAVTKHLGSSDLGCQRDALSLCRIFFETNDRDQSNLIEKNSILAARAFCQLLDQAEDTTILLDALQVAMSVTSSRIMPARSKEQVMRSISHLSKCTKSEEVAVQAALSYIRSASRAETRMEVLQNVIDFLICPHETIRHETLLLVKDISYWNPRSLLLDSLDSLDKLAEIISNGTSHDCSEAMQVCRQLASEDGTAPILCMNKSFISAIVDLVTREPIENRSAYINGVHIMIALMSDDSNMKTFLPFKRLLPWLIELANRTSDDDMKQQLVSVIIRFTVAKLDEKSPHSMRMTP